MVSQSEVVSGMTNPRPYALLAEITYRCPLHCPYCSNPIAVHNRNLEGGFPVTPGKTGLQELAPPCNAELSTDEWKRVIREAADLGILQIGFSGGEPLARRDLPDLIRAAREANLYSNLITSGIGLDDDRLRELRDAGLDSIQLSFQSDNTNLADELAEPRAYQHCLDVATTTRATSIP